MRPDACPCCGADDFEIMLRLTLEVLEPFAALADRYDPEEDDRDHPAWDKMAVPTLGDLRRVRALRDSISEAFNAS